MYFRFGTRKIVEAVAVLLQSSHRRRMGRLRLLKLLYIADRESLRETGRPIAGTKLVAMDLGPVHGEVYDLIKGSGSGEEIWSRFFQSVGIDVKLITDPGVCHLSEYEIAKLNEIAAAYRDTSDGKLSAITHDFEEWIANHKPESSKPIPMSDVLRAVGREEDEESILKDAKHVAAANKLFGVPS